MKGIRSSQFPFGVAALFALLVACGGGGGESGSGSTSSSMDSAAISGTALKGPVSGATVTGFAINPDGSRGTIIGSAQTDANGNFSMSIGRHSGPVMLQMSGGSYVDEATGSNMTLFANDVMTCAVPSMPRPTLNGVQITPLTSMAQGMAQYMSGGMTSGNITRANQAMGQYFNISDILMIHPMDPAANGSGAGATQDMRNYGMSIAAMSQYARNIAMPYSSGMVTAMMNDATDGRMDGMMTGQGGMGGGMMGSTRIEMGGGVMGGTMMSSDAGSRGMADAMTQFINSSMNKSGLTVQDMQDLMDKLRASNGQIQ